VRHEDHDPSVICRPGGYGLCETWPPEQPAPELAAAMAETHAVRDGYARLCEEFSDSPQSGQSARISLTVLNRHRKAAGLKPRRPAPAGEHRDPFMQATEERDRLRELLDEIGVMAANAPEDGDSFELLEEIAMRIAAHDAGLPS
jgi:alkanesulfonate monooxygenase SsuD/methylene tetrahydromethanopterin reductase-like flavin-dependent oxidoreductase (luciferase family)